MNNRQSIAPIRRPNFPNYLLVASLTACFSIVGCNNSDNATDNSSAAQGNLDSRWFGSFHEVAKWGFGGESDFVINGFEVSDAWIENDRMLYSARLEKITEFNASVYSVESEQYSGGLYVTPSGDHLGVLLGPTGVGVYQREWSGAPNFQFDDLNQKWRGRFYYEYREYIYELDVTMSCKEGICALHLPDEGIIEFDFIRQYNSTFEQPLGIWWGQESDSGDRSYTSARMSGDKKALVMPACWSWSAYGDTGFFDNCQVGVFEIDESVRN